MGEWILWGLNVVALVVLLLWVVRSLWGRRSRRKLFERRLDHLADGGPYVTFGFHQGPIEVHTQDGDVIATLPLEPGTVRIAEATSVLKEHGWRKAGPFAMLRLRHDHLARHTPPGPENAKPKRTGGAMTEFYTATDLEHAGYVRYRLTELFGEPDTTADEDRWSRETVEAVEHKVLAPAARVVFAAFEPDLDTRAGMIAADLRFGWPQMEQMLARVNLREEDM